MAFIGFPSSCSCLVLLFLFSVVVVDGQQLSFGFYEGACPGVENIARSVLQRNLVRDPTAPAALLRLAFHDCQVDGCDASIMLENAPGLDSELNVPENLGVRRLEFIDRIKDALESQCPGVVSCADVIAMAARDAISLTGGPSIEIPLGRRDGVSASADRAHNSLPQASITASDAVNLFGRMGMTTEESVAILGAHTVGVAHCTNFMDRIYPERDPNLNRLFYSTLRARCPQRRFGNNVFVTLDTSGLAFDNSYFRNILNGRGLLGIDASLGASSLTGPIVAEFANNRALFFETFESAFLKLTSFNVLTGTSGQIRTNCRLVNGF